MSSSYSLIIIKGTTSDVQFKLNKLGGSNYFGCDLDVEIRREKINLRNKLPRLRIRNRLS
jgi:hypothetical protein